MKLPRYSSTALPSTATISPGQAAAAAAAPGQFGAQVAGLVSDFATKMGEAEDRSQARKEDADASFKLKEFESDPRWEQDEIDDRPTEEVMFEEYDLLIKEMEGVGEKISSREVRDITLKGIRAQAEDVGLRIRDKGDQVRIRRTKARDKLTIQEYQKAGAFEKADDVIREGFDDGIYTSEERNVLLEVSSKLKRLEPYIGELGSEDFSRLEDKALEALEDKTLNADERIDMYRALSASANSREAEYYQDRSRRQKKNMVDMWSDFDSLSVAEIKLADVSPEQKKSAILMKRAAALTGASSDPQTVGDLYLSLSRIGINDDYSVESVSEEIAFEASMGNISYEDALELQQKALTVDTSRFKGVQFNDLVSRGAKDITQGMEIADFWEAEFFSEEIKLDVARLSNEWSREFTDAKIDGGAGFNPRDWFAENIQEYRDRANKIVEKITAPTAESIMQNNKGDFNADFNMEGFKRDIANSNLTDEEKAKALIDAGNKYGD